MHLKHRKGKNGLCNNAKFVRTNLLNRETDLSKWMTLPMVNATNDIICFAVKYKRCMSKPIYYICFSSHWTAIMDGHNQIHCIF